VELGELAVVPSAFGNYNYPCDNIGDYSYLMSVADVLQTVLPLTVDAAHSISTVSTLKRPFRN
jgi:hypothetical protein